jgi:hypothetical protein
LGTDTILPRADLRGDVWAVDRTNGRTLWKRTFPQRTVLRTPTLGLPFVIMVSLMGDRTDGNYHSLAIEIVDGASGETLGSQDNLLPDRILQLTYHNDESRVRLWGRRSAITLNLVKSPSSVIAQSISR